MVPYPEYKSLIDWFVVMQWPLSLDVLMETNFKDSSIQAIVSVIHSNSLDSRIWSTSGISAQHVHSIVVSITLQEPHSHHIVLARQSSWSFPRTSSSLSSLLSWAIWSLFIYTGGSNMYGWMLRFSRMSATSEKTSSMASKCQKITQSYYVLAVSCWKKVAYDVTVPRDTLPN